MTSHNYPETMHRSFVVNVPSIFTSLWNLAKPIMHPRTVKKIVICKGDYLSTILEDIPIQNIPVFLYFYSRLICRLIWVVSVNVKKVVSPRCLTMKSLMYGVKLVM